MAVVSHWMCIGHYVSNGMSNPGFQPFDERVHFRYSPQKISHRVCENFPRQCHFLSPFLQQSRQGIAIKRTREASKPHTLHRIDAAKTFNFTTAQSLTRSEKLANFLDWLATNIPGDASKFPVKPEEVTEGLGLVASRKVSAGEEIFAIPESLWMNLEAVAASPIGPFCKSLRPWSQVALLLIHEKSKPDSKWRPYIDLLPDTPDIPLYWPQEDLEAFQGTQLEQSVIGYREYVHEIFAAFDKDIMEKNRRVFPTDVFTAEAFLWAFAVIRSRAFPPLLQEDIALVPFADLLNHGASSGSVASSTPSSAKWQTRSQGLFNKKRILFLKTSRPYEAGEQVLMDYGGELSNLSLVLDYGFAEPPGCRERCSLTLSVPSSDPFFDDKEDIMQLAGFKDAPTQTFEIKRSEGPSENMLALLRLITLGDTDAFLLEALFRNSVWEHVSLPVSCDNEEAVCQAMISACDAALGAYPTTLNEDLAMLAQQQQQQLSLRGQAGLSVRIGEKQVLTEVRQWFEARLTELDKMEYYAERRLRNLGLMDDRGDMTSWVVNE